jgi:signal peptidase I
MNIHNTIIAMNPENIPKQENFLKEILKFTVIAIAIIIPVRTYIAQPFIVSGASMDPTFISGQYLIVDQLTYHLNNPRRGDVIILKNPLNPSIYFIKRVIGLPNETLIMNTGKVTIKNSDFPDGFQLDEKYITRNHRTSDTFEIKLSSTEYFVMGDNRPESSDSRSWGPLDEKFIVGRPVLRLFPFSKASIFPGI